MRMRSASGMALMTAIFLIVVLASLGLAMVTLSTGSQDTANKSLQAAKVYYGAKAGLEWGIQQAVAAGSCAGGSFSLAEGGLNGVSVAVTCVQQSTHGAGNFVYYLTSRATIGTLGGLDYAERRVEATVSNIP
jgi:MSHA biogenesis protein MshP